LFIGETLASLIYRGAVVVVIVW